jgi:hypothetical protein
VLSLIVDKPIRTGLDYRFSRPRSYQNELLLRPETEFPQYIGLSRVTHLQYGLQVMPTQLIVYDRLSIRDYD